MRVPYLKLLLEPGDVPVPLELPALLAVETSLPETEGPVQPERRVVRHRYAGVRTVDVFAGDGREQGRVERLADPRASFVRVEIDARHDRGLVGATREELGRGGVTEDVVVLGGDEQPVPSGDRVVREPFAARVHRG